VKIGPKLGRVTEATIGLAPDRQAFVSHRETVHFARREFPAARRIGTLLT
jgi:hypothetical protein